MKEPGLNEVFFATIVLSLNGYFIANVCGNEDIRDEMSIRENIPNREEVSMNSLLQDKDLPKFGERLQNITVPVGRDALLICVVDNLQTYKIAWLRVDTQTILTIQNHVITKNHRMVITHAEKRAWILKIRDVKESDMGWYMCQINTDPMKSQVAYLDVVVPPDILDYPTSTDMVVKEGSNVTLKCAATGSPIPIITWRREGGEPISVAGGSEVISYNGSTFSISRVDRLNMGAYLCIASNGIPPTVSKRVMLIVHFPPMIWIQNQLVGAAIGQIITLECQSEAFPKSINYWMKNDSIIIPSDRFVPETFDNAYKVVMKLTITSVDISDFGSYKCVAKNSLGDTDGAIKLYHIPHSTVITTILPTTLAMPTATIVHNRIENKYREKEKEKMPLYKSTIDVFSMSTNNVLIGATSSLWNTDGGVGRSGIGGGGGGVGRERAPLDQKFSKENFNGGSYNSGGGGSGLQPPSTAVLQRDTADIVQPSSSSSAEENNDIGKATNYLESSSSSTTSSTSLPSSHLIIDVFAVFVCCCLRL